MLSPALHRSILSSLQVNATGSMQSPSQLEAEFISQQIRKCSHCRARSPVHVVPGESPLDEPSDVFVDGSAALRQPLRIHKQHT